MVCFRQRLQGDGGLCSTPPKTSALNSRVRSILSPSAPDSAILKSPTSTNAVKVSLRDPVRSGRAHEVIPRSDYDFWEQILSSSKNQCETQATAEEIQRCIGQSRLKNIDIVKALLSASNIDVNAADGRGQTPSTQGNKKYTEWGSRVDNDNNNASNGSSFLRLCGKSHLQSPRYRLQC